MSEILASILVGIIQGITEWLPISSEGIITILYLLIFVSVTSLGLTQFNKSSNNLVNLNNIYNDYPLKKLSKEIDQQFESDYDILAFDSVLVLFYLDKPNFSYIVHPTNHNEQFITSKLIKRRLNKRSIGSTILINLL